MTALDGEGTANTRRGRDGRADRSQPRTEWLAGEIELDDGGFILTGPQLGTVLGRRKPWKTLGREPFLVETSRPGGFAVGDVRSGSTKMIAPAAGDGRMAVRFAGIHLDPTEFT